MLITTLHETAFEYDQPIRGTFTEARLWPMSDAGQTCHEFSLSVDPMRPMTESIDYHGNVVLTFNILPSHHRVIISGRSVVETHRDPFVPQEPPLSDFEIHKAHLDYTGFAGPVENLAGVRALADAAGFDRVNNDAMWFEEDSLFKAAQNLNALIHERFKYDTDATNVHTCVSQVFAAGGGVCQDFAHIFIAACRAAGFPARYVSGYLVTRRSRSAEGSSASHAWVEVLVPNHGWLAFDPTNNLLANDSYIKIAVGCDYRDVTPTRGVYKGGGINSRMRVRVHTMVEESAVEASRAGGEAADTPDMQRELVG